MRVEIWSDVVCVWCYIGAQRLEKALARFEYAGEVEIGWRSFQLDPSHPKGAPELASIAVAKKMGASVDEVRLMAGQLKSVAAEDGLGYDFDRAILVNTFDAHRLIHLAATHKLGDDMHKRLMLGHFTEGESVEDVETLVRISAEVGLPVSEVRSVLAGDGYAREVAEDIRLAGEIGATSVPFLLLDGGYKISGAQSVQALLAALVTVHDQASEFSPG